MLNSVAQDAAAMLPGSLQAMLTSRLVHAAGLNFSLGASRA